MISLFIPPSSSDPLALRAIAVFNGKCRTLRSLTAAAGHVGRALSRVLVRGRAEFSRVRDSQPSQVRVMRVSREHEGDGGDEGES